MYFKVLSCTGSVLLESTLIMDRLYYYYYYYYLRLLFVFRTFLCYSVLSITFLAYFLFIFVYACSLLY
jgi:hypothetical protein